MARIAPPRATVLLVLFLLLSTAAPSQSISYSQYRNLLSLSHSLMSRVANLRATRGDNSGAARARLIASKLEQGLGLGVWKVAWSVGWDYLKNYAWRDLSYRDMYGAAADVNELMRWFGELARAGSDAERAAWLGRNYPSVLRVSKSLFGRLLNVLRQSGPLREMVKLMQKEVLEGGLLWECLQIGSDDLNGLFQILKDMISQSYTTNGDDFREL